MPKRTTSHRRHAPERKAAAAPELPPIADRGAMANAIEPLLEGKSVHPETRARIVEQTAKYAEHAVRQSLKQQG